METKKILASDIINEFNLKIINKEIDLNREITQPSISRLGLELTDAIDHKHIKGRLVGWGTKENKYFKRIGEEKTLIILGKLFSHEIPLLILSQGIEDDVAKIIIQAATKTKTPVCKNNSERLASITTTIGNMLITHFAEWEKVHGSLIIINGMGVLIVGKSGVGKSEAILDLLQRGHSFVSDDSTIIKKIGNYFVGQASKITKGLLEARGIGLIDIPQIYGVSIVRDQSDIDIVIELVLQENGVEFDRLGNKFLKYEILGSNIPKIQIPVNHGKSIASLIETATSVFMAEKVGINGLKKFQENITSESEDN